MQPLAKIILSCAVLWQILFIVLGGFFSWPQIIIAIPLLAYLTAMAAIALAVSYSEYLEEKEEIRKRYERFNKEG